MSILSVLQSIGRNLRNHGPCAALYDIFIRSVNKCIYCRTLQCAVIDRAAKEYPDLPAGMRFMRLGERELLAYAANPENELTPEFIRQAFAKGDQCNAILDGTELASYGWYSRRPTITNSEDLVLDFDHKNYIYMYKAFTAERYRGQRLHAMGVTRSLAEFQALGFKGLLCYVESNNFDSLKSSYRMGYRQCGRIRVARIAGKYLIRTGPECRAYGLNLSLNPHLLNDLRLAG